MSGAVLLTLTQGQTVRSFFPFFDDNRLGSGLVDATIDVFNTITRDLLPTPQKSHYTFNLRDLAKVFQGIQRHFSSKDPGIVDETKCALRGHS